MSPFRPILRVIVLSAALAVPAFVSAAPANGATVTCPVVYWGSLLKAAAADGPTETIVNVRTGAHACYDRLVVDISGSGPVGYDIRYVDNVFTEGRGSVVALAGGAKIQIVVHAPNYDINTGVITYTPIDQAQSQQLTNLAGYRTFRQVAFGAVSRDRQPSAWVFVHDCRCGRSCSADPAPGSSGWSLKSHISGEISSTAHRNAG